ncbi:hypothetical protein EYF80_030167 [Liparis tanakae]|uniref:Uncharacterized protein n=1 Tax=Liparis tanakae TaxID=230148 RepID=A0A4Z2H2Q9_9TELE|nr:hypothetical protein EYF80_030167 [Liparis tanakae]
MITSLPEPRLIIPNYAARHLVHSGSLTTPPPEPPPPRRAGREAAEPSQRSPENECSFWLVVEESVQGVEVKGVADEAGDWGARSDPWAPPESPSPLSTPVVQEGAFRPPPELINIAEE